jgi:predicted transcriptional regulator of viral defense system
LVIALLSPGHRCYVSFVAALHLHGIVSQIPQTITLASTAHSRIVRTNIASYQFHRIEPGFFFGFDWYRDSGSFLIASPEKALLDCLYLAGRRGRRYAHFPELDLPPDFSFSKMQQWATRIHDPRLRQFVLDRIEELKRAIRSP